LNRVPGAGWSLWNSVKGRDGTRPAFRVGQVDAELLDEELLGLMKNQVGDALKYFGVSSGSGRARFVVFVEILIP
jgi:peroxin-2